MPKVYVSNWTTLDDVEAEQDAPSEVDMFALGMPRFERVALATSDNRETDEAFWALAAHTKRLVEDALREAGKDLAEPNWIDEGWELPLPGRRPVFRFQLWDGPSLEGGVFIQECDLF